MLNLIDKGFNSHRSQAIALITVGMTWLPKPVDTKKETKIVILRLSFYDKKFFPIFAP